MKLEYSDGKFYWRFQAINGEIVEVSKYTIQNRAGKGIDCITSNTIVPP